MISRATRLVAALTLAGAASIGTAGQPAAAAVAPTHVAIVVGGIGSACIPWHSGITGADVLDAHFDVVYGQPPSYAGFVLKINGVGKNPPDLTHYWAYFHNTGGGWAYSGSGATAFHPQPGTVEGWAYDDGQDPPPTPPSTSYATICAGQDPAPAPTPTQAPVSHQPSPPPAAQPVQPNPSSVATAGAPTTSVGEHRTAAPGPRRRPTASSSGRSAPASSDQATSDSSEPGVHLVGADKPAKHTSAAPALGTVLALLAAVGLGASAFWRLRRQKHG